MAKEPFSAKLTCIWTGGFLIWLIKGCKGKLSAAFAEQYNNRNFWTGYLAQMILLAAWLVMMIFKWQNNNI